MSRLYKFILFIQMTILSSIVIADVQNIDMFVGEVHVLGSYYTTRIAIGNGKVIRMEVRDKKELILIGESEGSSSIRLWLEDGSQLDFNVRVSANDPQIRMRNMVRMHVKMVEIRKSALEDLGINWSRQINGPAATIAGDFVSSGLFRSNSDAGVANLPLAVQPFAAHFGLVSSISSQINILASQGDAVTLAEPVLNCVDGGTASFLAGGEVPYPVTGSNGQTSVEFKEYGIRLNINPRSDSAGKIFAAIMTEISQIDSAVTVLGAPGILTRRTQTQVNVNSGETVVISGLTNADSSKDVDKVPFLGDLPFIGALFRSNTIRNQKSELVIFITPEMIEPDHLEMNEKEKKLLEFSQSRLDRISSATQFQLMD